MANLVKNIVVGRPLSAGGVWAGDLGAVLPTTATAALDGSLTGVGYISDAGLSETIDRATDKIKAWGGDVVKVLQTEFSVTWEYSMIESLRKEVNEEVYGEANVTVTPATTTTGTLVTVKVNSEQLKHRSRVYEINDGGARVRVVAPDCQITSIGDVTYADEDVVAYPVTVEGFRDANGNQAYKYMDDGVFLPIVATGATAGTPGEFTPTGAVLPANLAALTGITASPNTLWTVGQHVVLGDASKAYWSGSAWTAGQAPA